MKQTFLEYVKQVSDKNFKDGTKRVVIDHDVCAEAFLNSDIEEVVILEGVENIGSRAFGFCTELTNVIVLSNSLKCIGDAAFTNCVKLSDIIIPDSVTRIGASAFSNCQSLSITIPRSVQSIGAAAFSLNDGGTLHVDFEGMTEEWYRINEGNNKPPALCLDTLDLQEDEEERQPALDSERGMQWENE